MACVYISGCFFFFFFSLFCLLIEVHESKIILIYIVYFFSLQVDVIPLKMYQFIKHSIDNNHTLKSHQQYPLLIWSLSDNTERKFLEIPLFNRKDLCYYLVIFRGISVYLEGCVKYHLKSFKVLK